MVSQPVDRLTAIEDVLRVAPRSYKHADLDWEVTDFERVPQRGGRSAHIAAGLRCRNRRGLIYDDLVIMPNPATAIRNDDAVWDADGRVVTPATLRDDPLEAVRQQLLHTVALATAGFTRPRLHRIGDTDKFRGDTLSVFGADDGYVQSVNTDPGTARSGGTLFSATNFIIATARRRLQASNQTYDFAVGFVRFDTSSVPGEAEISQVSLGLYGVDVSTFGSPSSYEFEARYHTGGYGGGAPSTGDWFNLSSAWTTKPLVGTIALGSMNGSGYNNFVDTTNHANINRSGSTDFVVGTNYHSTGTFANNTGAEAVFRTSATSGTSQDPLLVVTYELPATVAPKMHHYRQLRS